MITVKSVIISELIYQVNENERSLAVLFSNNRYQAMNFKENCRPEELAVDLITLGQSILDDKNLKELS